MDQLAPDQSDTVVLDLLSNTACMGTVAVGPQNIKFDIIEYFTMCFCVLAVGP
jgi:hypothetical protein